MIAVNKLNVGDVVFITDRTLNLPLEVNKKYHVSEVKEVNLSYVKQFITLAEIPSMAFYGSIFTKYR